MELTVCSLAGESLCVVEMEGIQKLSELKDVIERRAKIPSRLQKLLLAGQILKNTENLQEVLAETPVGEITLIRTDKWIEEVEQDWRRLRKASDAVRNDRELVLAAINASEGQAIKYAGDEARSDAEIISAAMDFDSALCRYATGRLHTDRSFLLKALRAASTRGLGRKFHSYFRWYDSGLAWDREFMSLILQEDGAWLRFAPLELQNDPQLVRIAIESYPGAWRSLADRSALRGDREFAAWAVQRDLLNLNYVSEELRADRVFVLAALAAAPVLATSGSLLANLSKELRADGEVVAAALWHQQAWNVQNELQYVIGAARHHPEVRQLLNAHGLTAWPVARPPGRSGGRQRSPCGARKKQVEQGPERPSLHFSNELREILEHVDTSKQTLDFWLQLVERDPLVLGVVEEQQQEKGLVLAAVKKCGMALAFAKKELSEDLDIVRAALKNTQLAYDFIPEALRSQKEVALMALEFCHKPLPKELLSQKEVLVAAAQICQGRRGWSSQVGEGARTLKKLERMSLANLIAEYQLA